MKIFDNIMSWKKPEMLDLAKADMHPFGGGLIV